MTTLATLYESARLSPRPDPVVIADFRQLVRAAGVIRTREWIYVWERGIRDIVRYPAARRGRKATKKVETGCREVRDPRVDWLGLCLWQEPNNLGIRV